MEDYEERFAGLLFDQGRQRFRASNGAQRWMQRDGAESEVGEWMFAGVASDKQARELREYDGYEDFLIATGPEVTGLRAYLQEEDAKRRAKKQKEEEQKRAQMTEREVWDRMRAGIPMPHEQGDRPPPVGS
jgi:DNA-binding PucR family transcriptional regulator